MIFFLPCRIIDQLPKPNYHLLCHFLCVLYHISRRSTHNLMSAANLGVCVGPSLLWSDSPAMCPTEDLRTVPALVEILITHCELLCGPHVPNLLGDPRDSGTEESDCKCAANMPIAINYWSREALQGRVFDPFLYLNNLCWLHILLLYLPTYDFNLISISCFLFHWVSKSRRIMKLTPNLFLTILFYY